MSTRSLFRTTLIATGIALACAGAALSAFAESPTPVTFQPHNPWMQEVDNVTHDDNYHDYTVAIDAGKTLQVNLISQNPNLFFKVADTQGKQLVDTYDTGATTWSTPAAVPTTYSIHVYVMREAMSRGEVAKYALQVGQYGPADMQPATPATGAAAATAAKPAASASAASPPATSISTNP